MNKFKKILLGTLSALTLGLVTVVGVKVNAASLTYGTDVVTTTVYTGDTRTWGFTTNLPSSNTSIAVGSDINGIVNAVKGEKNTQINSSSSNGFQTYNNTEILVPVPSADSTGTVTRTGNSNGSRYLALGSNTRVALASPMTFDFDTDDIETNPTVNNSTLEGYYLRFITTGGEAKTTGISIQLKDGITTYGAAATLYTVTYMDGTTTLKTDAEAVDGSNITYTPKKYGYDLEGWYTDASLDSQYKVNTSTYTVTGDVTLYANWTAWTNTGIAEYTLSNAAIGKIATGVDGTLSDDLALTPSIYTYMKKSGAMTTTNVTLPGSSSAAQNPCFNTGGALTKTQCGLTFAAPANGTLTVWAGSGSSEVRNVKLMGDDEVAITPKSGEVSVPASYEPHEIVFEVSGGNTYYLGGEKGVRIYYVSFEAAATTLADNTTATLLKQFDADNNPTKLRLIGKIEGIEVANYSNISSVLMEFDFDGSHKSAYCYKLYKSVSSASLDSGDNTLYVVLTVNNVDKYVGQEKSLTNIEMTVTFNDESTTTATHTDIAIA